MDYSEIQKSVLAKLLKKYESSKTYAGEHVVNQTFSINPEKIFSDYGNDFADIDKIRDFENAIEILETDRMTPIGSPDEENGRFIHTFGEDITAFATFPNADLYDFESCRWGVAATSKADENVYFEIEIDDYFDSIDEINWVMEECPIDVLYQVETENCYGVFVQEGDEVAFYGMDKNACAFITIEGYGTLQDLFDLIKGMDVSIQAFAEQTSHQE